VWLPLVLGVVAVCFAYVVTDNKECQCKTPPEMSSSGASRSRRSAVEVAGVTPSAIICFTASHKPGVTSAVRLGAAWEERHRRIGDYGPAIPDPPKPPVFGRT